MMKSTLLIIAFFCSFTGYCQEDYILTINDSLLNVSLDKQYKFVVNGQTVNFSISSKDTLLFTDPFFRFSYPKDFKISKSKIDESIEQITMLSAEGTGIIIQKYGSLNPTSLNEMMLNELTKESVSYGFESKRSTSKKKLLSGQEVVVTKDVLRYKDEINIYEIVSYGKKDEGIIVVTLRMDDDKNTQGEKLIDLMWKTLRVN